MEQVVVGTLVGTLIVWSWHCFTGVFGCGAFDALSLTALPHKVSSFTSANYPKPYPYDMEECWKVEAPADFRVILETTHFEIEVMQSKICSDADYVDFRDGYYETSPLLRRLCGVLHLNITSTGNRMFIKFRSDQGISRKGFLLRYWAVPAESATVPPDTSRDGCKETSRLTAFDSTKSELMSPNYPNGYYPSLDKCWQLESIDKEKVIFLEVVESTMEQAYACQSGDYVEARDGTDPSDVLLDRWCGDSHPLSITSTGPFLLLRFHTDQTKSDFRGFRIRYSIVDPPVNPARIRTFETSTRILVGAGILLILLALVMSAAGYYKKAHHSRARVTAQARGSAQGGASAGRNQNHQDDPVRMAFEAILRRPSHRRGFLLSPSAPSNLQAPPPYEPLDRRSPTHMGFVAPSQPGYHPWMVRPRRREHRRRRSRLVPMYQPGTPLPPDPPQYDEIIKDIEQQEWILGPVLGADVPTITTVSQTVHGYEPDVVNSYEPDVVEARGETPSPLALSADSIISTATATTTFPTAPPLDYRLILDPLDLPLVGDPQTISPPGFITGDSPTFSQRFEVAPTPRDNEVKCTDTVVQSLPESKS